MSNEVQRSEIRGIVKKVLSGDTVIIRDIPRGRKPEEWMKSLAYINVPKLAKTGKFGDENQPANTKDEAYAWEAREFLRKKLIGQEIRYKHDYLAGAGTIKRDCGFLFLGDENINETMVAEGYATVQSRKQNETEAYKRLQQLEKEAIENKKGRHSDKESSVKRELTIDPEDPSSLERNKFPGIVEDVIDGSTLKISILTGPSKYTSIILMLAGIKCPVIRKDRTVQEDFAEEAKFCTECLLLNKDVQVRIDSVFNKRFYGSVICEGHDIAEHLLKQGFAFILTQSINDSIDLKAYRNAEREAKQKRLRIFKDHVETPIESKSQVYEVTEIINGDALKIKDLKTGVEKKIFLSSLRAPTMGKTENSNYKVRPLYDVPCMFEAREHLRKNLIGKKVQVAHDYIQAKKMLEPGSGKPDLPEKEYCTVLFGDNKNIAETLVSKGLATVVKTSRDDQRSLLYDQLIDAEMKASKSKKGIYGNPAPMRVVDLSTDVSKAKQYMTFLVRGGSESRTDGVVEYVYSSSRVKVYIPKENCLLNLILAGINAPKNLEPFGEEGMKFVRSMVHQRDVQVTVEAMDKNGNFIGYLYYDDKNISLELLKRGLAELRDTKKTQLIQAEKEAKEKRLGKWKDYKGDIEVRNNDESDEVEDVVEEKPEKKEKRDEVVITYISPQLTSIFVQYVANGPKLDTLLKELREELTSNPPLAGSYHVKKGEIVAAKFSADGLWYRAKVEKIVDKTISVLFIDYGNRENVTIKDVATLPSSKYSLDGDVKNCAKEVALAFVEFPNDLEQLEDAYLAFANDTRDKVLHMKREYTDPQTDLDHVTFQVDGNDVVLNLVTEGLILVEKKRRERRLDKVMSEYKEAQETAKRKRLNLWQYGDFTEDDAKEFGLGKK